MQPGSSGKLREAGARFYEKLDEEKLAAFGLRPSDYKPFEVWPENWAAFSLFASLSTQWRVGPAGATGLDYLVLYRELDDMGLTGDEREQMKADIRELEAGALLKMHEKE